MYVLQETFQPIGKSLAIKIKAANRKTQTFVNLETTIIIFLMIPILSTVLF